jgi:energy-coupling factor transporter ATP-binding protein EcfA2
MGVTGRYSWRSFGIEVTWPDEDVRQIGETVFSYHGVDTNNGTQHVHWRFQFVVEKADASLTTGARRIAEHYSGLQILGVDDRVLLWNQRSLGIITPEERHVTGLLHPDRHRISTGLDVDLFLIATFGLLALMQSEGVYALHAAALEAPTGEGVLLVAESDSGKSTLTTSLMHAGWPYLSDDSVIIETGDEGIVARPLRRDLGLDPEAAELFPDIERCAVPQLTDANKWCIDPEFLFPGRRVEVSRPRVVIFPAIIDADETRFETVSQAEALVALLSQSSFLTFDKTASTEYMLLLRQLVSQARCVRLLAGRDVLEGPQRVRQIFEDLLSQTQLSAA